MADTVNPIPLTDHMVPLNEIIVTASLIVAGRLDREILHDGFIKLVDQWPKLGARLVMGNKVCDCVHASSPLCLTKTSGPV